MNTPKQTWVLTLLSALFLCGVASVSAAVDDPVSRAIEAAIETNRAARASQKRIDRVDEQTQKMLDEYRRATWKAQQLQLYNQQLQALVESQSQRIAALTRQIDEVEVTRREIMPLMTRMVDTLDAFIDLDLPFLLDERRSRVLRLKTNLGDAELSLGERYRQIVEAYGVETEYGRSLEAWRGELVGEQAAASQARTVDMLRIGRLAMYYQSLDGSEAGYWDATTQSWLLLDERGRQGVRQGMRMAREQLAPDLLELPVPLPRVAR